jgi:hypothetical protein
MEYVCEEKRLMAGLLKYGNKPSVSMKYGIFCIGERLLDSPKRNVLLTVHHSISV